MTARAHWRVEFIAHSIEDVTSKSSRDEQRDAVSQSLINRVRYASKAHGGVDGLVARSVRDVAVLNRSHRSNWSQVIASMA
jgi:hypothetical protein